MITVKIGKIF